MKKWIFILVFILGATTTLILQKIDYNKFLPWSMQPVVEELQEPEQKKELTLLHIEKSPNGRNDIILYKRSFIGKSRLDYQNYLSNKHFYVLRDSESLRERYIYVGEERTGDPHWLGNDYVFFTTKCGTDCQGLYLLDTRDQDTELGVLSYMFDREFWETVFKDWFDREFRFPGLVKEIRSETLNGKSYLVFWMIDGNGIFLGEKRFLFTGKALVEQ